MNSPMFSIIMPTFNRFELEKRAIQSVLTQTYPGWELLITDASSDTRLIDWLDNMPDSDQYDIRYFKADNLPPELRRKEMTEIAKGPLLCYLDSDDYWRTDRLCKHFNVWRKNPTIALSFDATKDMPRQELSFNFSPGLVAKRRFLREMYNSNRVHMSALTISHHALAAIGGFPVHPFCDWIIGFECGFRFPCFFIPEQLTYRTVDSPGRISYQTERMRRLGEEYKHRLLKHHPLTIAPIEMEYFLTHGRKSRFFRPFFQRGRT